MSVRNPGRDRMGVRNPGWIRRSQGICEEWLLCSASVTMKGWLRQTLKGGHWSRRPFRGPDDPPADDGGLFLHEVRFLAERHPDPIIQQIAGDFVPRWREAEQRHRQQEEARERREAEQWERDRLKAEERQRKAEEREERIEARKRLMAESLAAHKEMYPGDVRKAANRTADLYLGSPVPRSLKQSMTIAAKEEQVDFAAIRSYLAGVGARALFAESGREVREPEWEEV